MYNSGAFNKRFYYDYIRRKSDAHARFMAFERMIIYK